MHVLQDNSFRLIFVYRVQRNSISNELKKKDLKFMKISKNLSGVIGVKVSAMHDTLIYVAIFLNLKFIL